MKIDTPYLTNKSPIVRLQGQPTLLFNDPQLTLLDALEQKQVRIFSECRDGFCGSCKTTIRSGSVLYIKQPITVLKDNECLPCCCIPASDLDLELAGSSSEMTISSPVNIEPAMSVD